MQKADTYMKAFMSLVGREIHLQTKNIKTKMKAKNPECQFSHIVLAKVKTTRNMQWWQTCGEMCSWTLYYCTFFWQSLCQCFIKLNRHKPFGSTIWLLEIESGYFQRIPRNSWEMSDVVIIFPNSVIDQNNANIRSHCRATGMGRAMSDYPHVLRLSRWSSG